VAGTQPSRSLSIRKAQERLNTDGSDFLKYYVWIVSNKTTSKGMAKCQTRRIPTTSTAAAIRFNILSIFMSLFLFFRTFHFGCWFSIVVRLLFFTTTFRHLYRRVDFAILPLIPWTSRTVSYLSLTLSGRVQTGPSSHMLGNTSLKYLPSSLQTREH
jgi:hypothetical protein